MRNTTHLWVPKGQGQVNDKYRNIVYCNSIQGPYISILLHSLPLTTLQKGHHLYHTKSALVSVIPKGTSPLSYQIGPNICHSKMNITSIVPNRP